MVLEHHLKSSEKSPKNALFTHVDPHDSVNLIVVNRVNHTIGTTIGTTDHTTSCIFSKISPTVSKIMLPNISSSLVSQVPPIFANALVLTSDIMSLRLAWKVNPASDVHL